MILSELSMADLQENLHQMRVLQSYSYVMQPKIRHAIEQAIIVFQEEIRSRMDGPGALTSSGTNGTSGTSVAAGT